MNLYKITLYSTITLLVGVLLFHGLVITQIIPYTIVWGGKLKNTSEMYVFEIVSIAINLLLLVTILLKTNMIKHQISPKIIHGILWVFVFIFALNTLGNLFAESWVEKLVFTPLTLFSAIALIILIKNPKETI